MAHNLRNTLHKKEILIGILLLFYKVILMKSSLLLIIFLSAILSINEIYAQPASSAWSIGFGAVYPRFVSVTGDGYSGNTNFGGYLSFERNFSEYISLRVKGGIYHLESYYYTGNTLNLQKVNAFTGDLDLIYTVLPCEDISPFILAGGGFVGSKSQNSFNAELNDFVAGYEVNLGLGAFWTISDAWKLKGEMNYHTLSHNKLDGNYSINEQNKGIFGGNGDTYMTFELGFIWQFSQGEPSRICKKCPEGIKEVFRTDTVYKEVPVVKIEKDTLYRTKPMLFNVNFDFDKSDIRVESYPILEHAVDVLKEYPDMKVVISGHTDSFGSDAYNIKLSQRRVNSVYDYLVSHGISKDRITEKAYGEKQPVRENTTSLNRAFNRRVEFQIVN